MKRPEQERLSSEASPTRFLLSAFIRRRSTPDFPPVLPAVLAILLAALQARGGSVQAIVFEPSEWNFGVRPQKHLITRVIRLRPAAGARVRIVRLRSSCDCLTPEIRRGEGTPDSPAEIGLVVDTNRFSGRMKWLVFISLAEPEERVVQYPVGGWIRQQEGPGKAEVFYLEGEPSSERLLEWWRSAGERAGGSTRVRLLSVGVVENYRRLRELERKAGLAGPPPDIIAFVDGDIALRGEAEVRAGLAGFINLDSDGRPNPSTGGRREKPPRASVASDLGKPRTPSARFDAHPVVQGRLEVWIFYFSDCRDCREALAAVRSVAEELGEKVRLRVFDAARDPESVPRAFAMVDAYPEAPKVLPSMIALVGDELLLGADVIADRAASLINEQLARGGGHLRIRQAREKVGRPFAKLAGSLRLLPVVLAGLADGVNPCAFAAMILLISILSTMKGSGGATFRDLFLGGGAFCAALFVTYYLAGLALFAGAKHLEGFHIAETAVFWAVWTLALAGGILSAADAVVYLRTGDPDRVRLKVPEGLRRRFAPLLRGRFKRLGLVVGGLVGGVLIAFLEGVCTGQMYLPVIQYMARTPGLRARGAAYLLLYNFLFILPLLVILGVALAGVHFHRLSAFLRRHLGAAKLGLAAVFFLLAGVMFVTR